MEIKKECETTKECEVLPKRAEPRKLNTSLSRLA